MTPAISVLYAGMLTLNLKTSRIVLLLKKCIYQVAFFKMYANFVLIHSLWITDCKYLMPLINVVRWLDSEIISLERIGLPSSADSRKTTKSTNGDSSGYRLVIISDRVRFKFVFFRNFNLFRQITVVWRLVHPFYRILNYPLESNSHFKCTIK